MKSNNYQGVLQKPIGSGFTASSTSTEVIKGINLNGKIAIVTGGNTGIGLETTKTLASAGATVIVLARNLEKAKTNLEGIPNIEFEEADIMNPLSIDRFSQKFLSSNRPLHLLINNAGIMWVPLQRDQRGIESQLAINYLGQFHLTANLWIALKQANGARVVNVSSLGHHNAAFDFEDPNFEKRDYETLLAYGQSKTASNLFALELDNRAKEFNVRAYSLHPGSIGGTELGRNADVEQWKQLGFLDESGNIRPEILAGLKTIPQGVATTIFAATSPLLNTIGGVYLEDGDIAELIPTDSSIPTNAKLHQNGVQQYSLDEISATRLWDFSQKMTGVTFSIG